MYLLLPLLYLHKKKTNTPLFMLNFLKLSVFVFFLALIAVRFNIINSIHNFINIDSQNQYLYIVFTIIIVFLTQLIKVLVFINKNKINMFYFIFILLFYLVYIFNIVVIDWFLLKYNPQTNIKQILVYLSLLWVIFINSFLKKQIIFISMCYITLLVNIKYYCLYIIPFIYVLQKNKSVVYIHTTVLLFFCLSFYQIYIFNTPVADFYTYSVSSIKVSHNQTTIFECFENANYKNKICVTQDFFKNSFDFNININKNIFEKKLFFSNFNINEFYNFNNQELIQTNNIILCICLLHIYIFFIYLNKKNIFHIYI